MWARSGGCGLLNRNTVNPAQTFIHFFLVNRRKPHKKSQNRKNLCSWQRAVAGLHALIQKKKKKNVKNCGLLSETNHSFYILSHWLYRAFSGFDFIFNDFYYFHYNWFTVVCQFSTAQQSDPVSLSPPHTHIHILFLTLSSIMFHHR